MRRPGTQQTMDGLTQQSERETTSSDSAGPDTGDFACLYAEAGLSRSVASEQEQKAEMLVAGEKRLLELIGSGETLETTLEAICRFGEELSDGVLVSILLVSPDGKRLRHGAAPGLPQSYTQAIDGGLIGPEAGSCGTAAYRKEPVLVADIAADPLWARYRELALGHKLRACWSMPIFSSNREVIGTFALYRQETGMPTVEQRNLIERLTHLAAVAIERKRAAEALQASEQLARGQVEALGQTLKALAGESNTDRLVEHVLRTIVGQLGAHSSGVWLRNEQTGRVAFEFAFEQDRLLTASDAALAAISPAPDIEEMWPEVFRTRSPVVAADLLQERGCPLREHLLAMGVATVLIVPMLIAGNVEGVISIRFTEKRTFRPEEIDLAQALAHQAMLSLQLTRLWRESRRAAVIAERNRVARDIHDTLAQGFTGVIVQLEAAADASAGGLPQEAAEHVARAGELARAGLREARRSVRAMRPQALEANDLCGALPDMIKQMTEGTNLSTDFKIRGERRPLDPLWEENLLRVSQEVLTNTIRHAQASRFGVEIAFEQAGLQLALCDDGRGFDPAARFEGFGLLGIRERVESLGGRLKVQSRDGRGTAIFIHVPLVPNSAQPIRNES